MNRIDKALAIIQAQKKNNATILKTSKNEEYITAFNTLFRNKFPGLMRLDTTDQVMEFHKIFMNSTQQRGKSKNVLSARTKTLLVESWLVGDDEVFAEGNTNNIRMMEDVIMGLMIYLLGGFTFPVDKMREKPLRYITIDVGEIIAEPRKSFLLLNIDPRHMLAYFMWRSNCLFQALSRSHWVSTYPKEKLDILINNIYIDATNENRIIR
jgi:hypothetical protein